MKEKRKFPVGVTPTKAKVHVINSSKQKRRLECSRLIRNKWFIIGVTALILLIILAVVLGVTLGTKKVVDESELIPLLWWQNATIYRIYVPSFADSDGDGLGDFKGIEGSLNYIKELGVDVIWLSPIQATGTDVSGLDILDFQGVKDKYGTLQDFRDLMTASQALGIKVIMDIVLNHAGNTHTWFKQSKWGTAPYKDYFIWNQGKVTGSSTPLPPNNWKSVYGGSAWQWEKTRQEFYLRQFWSNEADLNYRNPQIVQEMNKVASFWLNQGVDGFYLRDGSFLVEDAQLRDENQLSPSDEYSSLSHNYTRDLLESFQALSQIFSSIIQSQSINQQKILVVESTERIINDEKNTEIYQLMESRALYKLSRPFTGLQLKAAVQQSIDSLNETMVWPMWTLGDEERSRVSSKFDYLAVGLQVTQLLLPGICSIYYGEEIQLRDHPSITFEDTVDMVAIEAGRLNYTKVSRDPFRTPMRWNSTRHAGFTSATTPWLPSNNNDPYVEIQKTRPNSLMNTIRDLNAIKKSSLALTNGTIDYPLVDADIFSFARMHPRNNTGYLMVWNVGNQRKTLTFNNITYLSNELTTVRKIKPDGSNQDSVIVKKYDVGIDARELIIFSFWKNNW